jgi:hypothetical protein
MASSVAGRGPGDAAAPVDGAVARVFADPFAAALAAAFADTVVGAGGTEAAGRRGRAEGRRLGLIAGEV